MVWSIFLTALGLLFVFEGILPFAAPSFWRRMMQQISVQRDAVIRIFGLISMLIGLVIVSFAHDLF